MTGGIICRLGRMKWLLAVMAVAYLTPMALAMVLVAADISVFRELQIKARAAVFHAGPIPAIGRLLDEGRLVAAIAFTFAWNFGVAACIGSIATGALLPLPPLVASLRGFLIGLLFADGMLASLPLGLAMGGTFLLEIGAYVLAGALGMRLGLAVLPRRGKGPPIRQRMAELAADFRCLLPLVAALLLLGAVWEIVSLYLLRRFP